MDCRAAVRLIPAFLDGELQPAKRALLSDHLASCDSCRAEMAAMNRAMDVLGEVRSVEPEFTLSDVMARVAERRGRRRWMSRLYRPATAARWATAVGVAAAIVVGAIGGVGLQSVQESSLHPPAASGSISDALSLGASDDPVAGLTMPGTSGSQTGSGGGRREGGL